MPIASHIRVKLVDEAEAVTESGRWYGAFEMTEAIAQLARNAGARYVDITRFADGRWKLVGKGARGEKVITASGVSGPRPNGVRLDPAIRAAVVARDGKKCRYCGEEAFPPHIDHILATARGGTDEMENLTVACPACNMSKGDQLVEEWFTAKFKRELAVFNKGFGAPWITRVDPARRKTAGASQHEWKP